MKKNWLCVPLIGKFRKLLLTMKLAAILSFALIVSLNGSVLDSYGQGARLTLKIKDATLKEAMDKIEKSSDFIFVYYDNIIDVNQKVSLDVNKQPIEEILDKMFESTNNTYKVFDRQIVISMKIQTEIRKDSSATIQDDLQQRTISGTVTGANNEPMAGVTVVVKGTTLGALTDPNGKFTLSIPASTRTLVISFVGMQTKEVEIGSSNVYNVVLSESLVGLEEVVVVGYGTQKKISITGAIVSVGSTEMLKSPNASISNTLAGRVTGVTTVQLTGMPGGEDPAIYVRGVGSLTASASTPLILVDGVQRSFTQIDPNEIESISILKDASATAVYGIRGANGVIIVTTKRGVEGAPKISFTSTFGLQVPTRIVKMADSYTYASRYNEAILEDDPNGIVKFSPLAIESFRTGKFPLIFPNSNWSSMLVKDYAPQTQENINISGGSKIVKYFISLGYLYQDGLYKTLSSKTLTSPWNYNRYNYRANIDLDMTPSTKFSLTIGGRNEVRGSSGGVTDNQTFFYYMYRADPFTGALYQGKRILTGGTYFSMPQAIDGLSAVGWGTGVSKQISNIMNLDIGVTQKLDFIAKGLSWRFKVSNNSTVGHSKTRSTSQPTYEPLFKCDADPTAIGDSSVVFRRSGSEGLLGYSESSSKSRNWYLESAFSYDHQFGDHNITGLLLYNESRNPYPGSFSDIPTGYVGIAARATYSYRSKYLVDLNLGYNGSENFAPGKRFGLFPAASIGWVLTEENFLKNKISFLDYLKLRFSYGIVGNDQGGSRFLYLPDQYSISSGGYSFGTDVSILQLKASEGKIGNADVTWEKSAKQNYGIDLKVFKGKLGVSADYFYELRNNILTTRKTLPVIFNMTLPTINLGRVENHGYEAELKWRDKFGRVNYNLTANMSFARNKILYLDEVPQHDPYLYRTGQPVGTRWGYVFDGLWTAEDIAHLSDFPDASYTPKPGDARYKDLNNDKKVNDYDQKPIGYPDYPEYIFSFQGGADYKGFDISFLWTGVTNVTREMASNQMWRTPYLLGQDGLMQMFADKCWTPATASTATFPRITFTGMNNNSIKTSTLYDIDASYIRLKNIELGYSFSVAALKRLGISSLRVSATGYNLITLDKVKYFDPEQTTSAPQYPLVKIFSLGLNVNF